MRRRLVAIATIVTLFLLLSVIGFSVAADSPEGDRDIVYECAETPKDDFAPPENGTDTIGWVDGYWYNQPLNISSDDGLSEAELHNVSARTAARVEAMRCLTFEELPPVEVIDRDEFAAETEEQFARIGEEERLIDNAQLETMLLIGSDVDSIDVRAEDQTATVGGYYNFVENRTVIITDDPDTFQIDEEILAHELGHALQDQHFDLAQYNRPTKDIDAGKLGMIEGDVHRIEQQYLQHCDDGNWTEPCVTQDATPGGAGQPANIGLFFANFQPYSDGPNFVQTIYDEGGWDAVNAVYEDMPETSRQVIYPDEYREFTPDPLFVPDTSAAEWERLEKDTDGNYNVLGQAALSAMFVDTAYEDGDPTTGPIVTQDDFLNIDPNNPQATDPFNPYNYDLPQTDGWAADRLHTYSDGTDAGTVWASSWATPGDMEDFKEAYIQLIEFRGGQESPDYENTWTFGPESDFDMALTLEADGNRLTIVTAPAVNELESIHSAISLEPVETDDTGNSVLPLPSNDGDDSAAAPGDDNGVDDTQTDDIIPGFSLFTGFLALLASIFLLRKFVNT